VPVPLCSAQAYATRPRPPTAGRRLDLSPAWIDTEIDSRAEIFEIEQP
jgi:hypothetical protein